MVFRELVITEPLLRVALAELQVDVIAMSFACALCLCCVLRSCGSANLLLLLQSRQIVKARDQA